MATNPTLLISPIAENGDKNTIPETTSATSGLLSQDKGWQSINSLPLTAGGIAPNRLDFNGAFNLLSKILFFAQKGWQFQFDEDQDYYAGCIVRDTLDGKLYECIADVSVNATPPSADTTHWKEFGTDTTVLANTDLSNLTATGLNAFATKTLSNLDTSNLTYHLVVDSYYNDTTGDWYRVFDDGWVEQGGYIPTMSAGKRTITLLKAFVDTHYTIHNDANWLPTLNSGAIADMYFHGTTDQTTTTFSFYDYSGGAYIAGYYWRACGMGASV